MTKGGSTSNMNYICGLLGHGKNECLETLLGVTEPGKKEYQYKP